MGGLVRKPDFDLLLEQAFATALIELFSTPGGSGGGTKRLAEFCDVRSPSITAWKTKGVPNAWRRVIALEFPKLYRTAKLMAGASVNKTNVNVPRNGYESEDYIAGKIAAAVASAKASPPAAEPKAAPKKAAKKVAKKVTKKPAKKA